MISIVGGGISISNVRPASSWEWGVCLTRVARRQSCKVQVTVRRSAQCSRAESFLVEGYGSSIGCSAEAAAVATAEAEQIETKFLTDDIVGLKRAERLMHTAR